MCALVLYRIYLRFPLFVSNDFGKWCFSKPLGFVFCTRNAKETRRINPSSMMDDRKGRINFARETPTANWTSDALTPLHPRYVFGGWEYFLAVKALIRFFQTKALCIKPYSAHTYLNTTGIVKMKSFLVQVGQ